MAFQIYCLTPVYCPFTDGLLGSNASLLPNLYETEALAHKIAGRLSQADFEGFGDNSYRVVEAGKSPYSYPRWPEARPYTIGDDEIPF